MVKNSKMSIYVMSSDSHLYISLNSHWSHGPQIISQSHIYT